MTEPELTPLAQRLDNAMRNYRSATGLEMNKQHLQIRINPTEWLDWRRYWQNKYGMGPQPDSQLFGVQVFRDPDIEYGKPELRSTWSCVI